MQKYNFFAGMTSPQQHDELNFQQQQEEEQSNPQTNFSQQSEAVQNIQGEEAQAPQISPESCTKMVVSQTGNGTIAKASRSRVPASCMRHMSQEEIESLEEFLSLPADEQKEMLMADGVE